VISVDRISGVRWNVHTRAATQGYIESVALWESRVEERRVREVDVLAHLISIAVEGLESGVSQGRVIFEVREVVHRE